MDFRFLEFLKEIINDTLYASIAKLAIAFYLGKKFIQFLITGFNIAYQKKEEQKEDIQYKKDVIELKEAQKKADLANEKRDLANEKRDLKTHEILKSIEEKFNKLDEKVNKVEESQIKVLKDLNAYKDKKHNIENENIENIKIIKRNTDLFEKLNNKL